MTEKQLRTYSVNDILDTLMEISDDDILIQCKNYKKNFSELYDYQVDLFYKWVIKVIVHNRYEFLKRLRSKKIKKINQSLHHRGK